MVKMKCFKEKLEDNKIYLDTIVAILVGLMAFIVSCKANSIAQKQTQIQEAQALPIFVVSSSQKLSYAVAQYEIRIENDGTSVIGLYCNALPFLRIRYNDEKYHQKEIWLPIEQFYDKQTYTGTGKGRMVVVSGEKNIEMYQRLVLVMGEFIKKLNGHVEFGIVQYVELTYHDIFNKSHADYFCVPWVSTGWKVSNKEGNQKLKLYEKLEKVNLTTITADTIYDFVVGQ